MSFLGSMPVWPAEILVGLKAWHLSGAALVGSSLLVSRWPLLSLKFESGATRLNYARWALLGLGLLAILVGGLAGPDIFHGEQGRVLFFNRPFFMIRFVAEIDVMPHDALLDPQGKAVLTGLAALSLSQVHDVRVGKHLRLRLEAHDQAEAEAMVNKACRELLANPVMESFAFRVLEEQ